MYVPSGSAYSERLEVWVPAVVLKSKRARGGLKNHDCSPLIVSAPTVVVSLYVTLYSVAFAELRTWAKDGPPADGTPVATVPDPAAGVAAAPPVVVLVVPVAPPHDAAITNA